MVQARFPYAVLRGVGAGLRQFVSRSQDVGEISKTRNGVHGLNQILQDAQPLIESEDVGTGFSK